MSGHLGRVGTEETIDLRDNDFDDSGVMNVSDIFLIGGHGKVALLLTSRLAEQGHAVTSVIRNPDQAEDIEKAGGTPLVLDIEQASESDLAEAMREHRAVVWSAGAGGGNPDRTYAVDRDAAIRSMDAAKDAGVKRYVMVSYLGASTDHGVPEDDPFFAYAEAKGAADAYLRDSGLDWTILMPGQLTLKSASNHIEVDPELQEGDSTETSRANVAMAIDAALSNDATIGREYPFRDGSSPIAYALSD